MMNRVTSYFVYILSFVFILQGDLLAKSRDPFIIRDSHPRLVYTAEDFARLRKEIRLGENQPLLSLHQHSIDAAEKSLREDYVITYTKDASNKRIASVSYKVAGRMVSCAYAYRMTGSRKFLTQAVTDLKDVCAFPDWNPSHFLDVAGIAGGVALTYDWLYKELKKDVRELVETRLREYALEMSRVNERRYTWFYTVDHNWNQVCNSGLICAAAAIYETCPELAKEVIEDAIRTNIRAMDVMYAPDGAYPEGPGYWGYGTNYQVLMNTVLESAMGTDFGISRSPGFLKTGYFKLAARSGSGKSFNFADNGEDETSNLAMWYFAAKTQDPEILRHELEMMKFPAYAATRVHLPVAIRHAMEVDTSTMTGEGHLFYSAQGPVPMMMCRTGWDKDDHYLAVKGGTARYNHGHMDCGSFVYDAYGERWAMDFRFQPYTSLENPLREIGGRLFDMSQNSLRWRIFRMNCRQHNTLTVNDKDHKVSGLVKMTSTENTPDRMSATFNMTPLFWGDLENAVRTVAICDGNHLEVKDVMKAPDDRSAHVRWTMATEAVPEITSEGIVLVKNGKRMLLKAEGADVTYNIWTTDPKAYESPVSHLDFANPGTYLCGYEIDIPASTEYTISITLFKN